MAVDATLTTSAPASASVTGAIQKASRLTGTNFQYLLAAAKVESNLNPNAAAKTSSAGGLFQFIEQTWLGTLKEAGPSLGYGRYADAISRTGSGRFVVTDPAMRREVMQLRQDATANAVMAGAFTKSNAAYLTRRLGRAPSEGELYIAHFLGAGGAAKLIGQAATTPDARAADAFPAAARANRSIFFSRDGRARNFADVTRTLTGRFDVARARQAPADAVTASVAPSAPAARATALPQRSAYVAERARVARAYEVASPSPATPPVRVAQNEPVFHNPYRTERRQPVASVVSERWITRQPPASDVTSGRTAPSQAAPNPPAASQTVPTRQAAPSQPAPSQASSSHAPSRPPQPAAPSPNEVVQTAHANLRPRYTPRSDDPPLGRPQSEEPLGLFQDMRPNARALFTGG